MQTRHRLAPILPLLGGLVLVSGLCGPAAAQDNTQSTTTTQTTTTQSTPTTTTTQTTTTQTTMTNPSYSTSDSYWSTYYALPEPLKYPEWSPGVINTLHWTDWTETNWATGSTYEVELDRMKAEREFWANREKNGQMTAYYEPGYGPEYQNQALYYREEAPPAGPAFYGGESMAASGDFVYTVEDGTLYQFRASDLSLVTQHSLPTSDTSTGNMGRWSSVAASGSYVYLLRGDTLYQFRTSDLSQANTATLPAPNVTTPPPSRRARGMWMGRRSVAASGDYVFVRRGGTLYQFRASDLSLVTQTAMPIPNATTPPAPAAGTP